MITAQKTNHKTTKSLSELQKRMLQFFRSYATNNDRPPTIREICDGVGRESTSVITYNLNILIRHGLIRKNGEGSRAYSLAGETARDPRKLLVSAYRRIVAGQNAHNVVLDMLLGVLSPIDRDVFSAVLAQPGITARGIAETMPEANQSAIFQSLKCLINMGLIEKIARGEGTGFTYTVKRGD